MSSLLWCLEEKNTRVRGHLRFREPFLAFFQRSPVLTEWGICKTYRMEQLEIHSLPKNRIPAYPAQISSQGLYSPLPKSWKWPCTTRVLTARPEGWQAGAGLFTAVWAELGYAGWGDHTLAQEVLHNSTAGIRRKVVSHGQWLFLPMLPRSNMELWGTEELQVIMKLYFSK